MPVTPASVLQSPDYWNVYGHSYLQYNFGTRSQAGRSDSLFRAALDVEFNNFVGHAANGSRLSSDGLPNAGWARVMQNVAANASVPGAPYVAQSGAYLFGWGINDLGTFTDTAQFRTAWQHAVRLVVSRARASSIREDQHASLAYGASWTQTAFTWDWSGGDTVRSCTTAANDASHTITLTLPSDYGGEIIGFNFVANAGVVGGTITWGGTAGVTGTDVISNLMPSATLNHSPYCKRITNLTAANAGQTITMIMTQVDASGSCNFDGYWFEARTPNMVLLYNIAKLTSTGYAVYTTPPTDVQVDTWNAATATVVAEFDSGVQIVDINTALDKTNFGTGPDARLGFDGLHPTEFGAASIADATLAALRRARPVGKHGQTAAFNSASQRSMSLYVPYRDGQWYTTETTGDIPQNTGTTNAYVAVSGDVFAIPFFIGQDQMQISQWSLEKIGTRTVAETVFFNIYDDRQYRAFPQYLHAQPSNSTALSIGTGAGVFTSTTTSGQNGYILQPLDPGLYWLCLKIVAIATGTAPTLATLAGQSQWIPNLASTGARTSTGLNGYKLTGQGTGVMSGRFPPASIATATPTANCPYIGLKMQWLGQGM
jgi:hypothetical protein